MARGVRQSVSRKPRKAVDAHRSGVRRWLAGAGALALMVAAALGANAATLRPAVDGPALAALVAEARPGDVVEVPPGTWSGPLVVGEGVTLAGRGGVIDGGGKGRAVTLAGPRAALDGVEVTNSGKETGTMDACVFIERGATGARVRGTRLSECGYGIWVSQASGVQIVDNRIFGSTTGSRVERGNGIHLYATRETLVSGNLVRNGADGIYIFMSGAVLIRENRLIDTRYGVHYMYAHDNALIGNVVTGALTGYALMQSRGLTVKQNVATRNSEKGILFRDVQHCDISANLLEDNAEGMFFYSSTSNTIAGNRLVRNRVGMKIWAGTVDNRISGDAFVGNATQVLYSGTSDLAIAADGRGNYWSDYVGWDQDGDGVGDRPYRVDSFTTRVIHQYPAAALLLRSPALELLSHMEEALPIFRTPTVIDRHPAVRPDQT
ncbi:MAG: nitrous oxide reductase family maturation protein NosD [Polyangiaceae bacterium]|nr:nitrous oxide reductase family maturation protein NosD [Polyangiaceae bacterium]